MPQKNPLNENSLTSETVRAGDRIVVYVPHTPSSANRYKVLNEPYVDDDEDFVVELLTANGREITMLTSEAGLSGGRYDGIWTHVALTDEE